MTTGGIRFTPTRTGWNLRDFPGKGAPIRAKARRCVWADREMTVKTHTARSPFSVAALARGDRYRCDRLTLFRAGGSTDSLHTFGPFQNHEWPPLADVMLDPLLQMPGLNNLLVRTPKMFGPTQKSGLSATGIPRFRNPASLRPAYRSRIGRNSDCSRRRPPQGTAPLPVDRAHESSMAGRSCQDRPP
jgi:hypothetical protein